MRRAVGLAVAGFGTICGLFPVFDGDLFWHLASGRWMVEHGAVPRVDPFRFSAEALPWVDHEWLFQLIVYALERAVGIDGLVVLRALALGGFGVAVLLAARRASAPDLLAGALAAAAVLGVRPRFLDRPEIPTLFAVLLLLTLLERGEASRRTRSRDGVAVPFDRRAVVALAALVVVWVNLHGEALLAPGLAGLFLIGSAVDEDGWSALLRASAWKRIVGVPVLLAGATLVNPYGPRILEVAAGIRATLSSLAASNPEWMTAFEAPQPFLFGGLAALGALAIGARLSSGRWPALAWGLPTAALALLALTAVRHQALVYAAGAPFAARALIRLRPEARTTPSPGGWAVAAFAAALALLAVWATNPPASGPLRPRHGGLSWGVGLRPGSFPVGLVDRLEGHPEIGPLYNEFAHGGYLLWRLHPPRRVFLDGRMELEPRLLAELEAARRSSAEWTALLRRRGARGALVRHERRRVPVVEPDGRGGMRLVETRTANSFLFSPPDWVLADWDDDAMLFLARDEPNPLGAPYRWVDPEDPGRTIEHAARDPVARASIRGELERKLGELPGCRRARRMLEALEALEG